MRGSLLDVGCGRKPYVSLFPRIDKHIGIDIPTSMHGLSQVDVAGSILFLPFTNDFFDNVLCTEVLEHVPEPLMALREMWRVAKPGGILLLTVPLSEQLHEEPYDFYRFTKYVLDYILRKSDWQVLRKYERGGTWLELGYRFSSFLYSSIGAKQSASGILEPRSLLGPPIVVACTIVQLIAAILDKVWRFPLSTIGYGVVAQKPNECLG